MPPLASQNAPILECRGIAKSFGERVLFSKVDLSLRPGESMALLGPSGSGKSTLLNCLEGIEPVDSGTIALDGIELSSLDERGLSQLRRQTVGTVFQFFHLLPTLTASENVELGLQLSGMPQKERKTRAAALLERLGIGHRSQAFPRDLSGGEMQRVAIARAVAHRPRILFADEPTGNLDAASGTEALALLTELCSEIGAALFMVTHSRQAAASCSSRYTLDAGQLRRLD